MIPKQNVKVVPIRRGIHAEDEVREVADLAYDLWLANKFRRGFPEEALFTAVRQLRGKGTAGLFLLPRRRVTVHPFPALRRHLNGSA